MAIDFDGIDDYIEATSAPVTGAPLTMACWFNPDNDTQNHLLMALTDGTSSNRFLLEANGNLTNDPVRARTTASGTDSQATVNGFVANSWQHAVGRFASASSRQAFLNGTGGSVQTTSRTPTGINNTRLGNQATAYLAGLLAEAAIWNTDLTDDEITALAKGYRPSLIRPDNLVLYVPLIRNVLDISGGVSLTTNGTTVAPHVKRIA